MAEANHTQKTAAPAEAGAEEDATADLSRLTQRAKAASELLKALANENRLLLLCMLANGERSVTELEDALGLRQPTVSQQLARLRAENLVSFRRDGKAIYYALACPEVRRIVTLLYHLYCAPKSAVRPSELEVAEP